MTDLRELVAAHGSPLWIVDLDRARANLAAFRAAWQSAWPDVRIAYSLKTNRLPQLVAALVAAGADAEAVCGPEYVLAREVIGVPGERLVVNGPVKPDALLAAAGHDGALVVADASAELARMADAGVRRAGVRVAMSGAGGAPSRFGIPCEGVEAAVAQARHLDMEVEVLACHLVSTDLAADAASTSGVAGAVTVRWPRPPDDHVAAARALGGTAVALEVPGIDLGGGFPAAPAVLAHAQAVAAGLRQEGFQGALLLEPGRALVADAAELVMSVVAVKGGPTGPVVIADAGTNLLPGALWRWPAITALDADAQRTPTMVTGPLCLNIDVLHPAVHLPPLRPGDLLVATGVGAYQDVQSTQFGDLRPAVVVRDRGRLRLVRPREGLAVGLRTEARLEGGARLPARDRHGEAGQHS